MFERWGLRPQTPVPPAAGGFAPRPPMASGSWGLRSQIPTIAPYCEFLATRLSSPILQNTHTLVFGEDLFFVVHSISVTELRNLY